MAERFDRTDDTIRIESMPERMAVVDHVGLRATSEAEYQLICATLRNLLGEGDETLADGHQRTFFRLTEGIGGPRIEVQLWDTPERRRPGVHIDMRSRDPMGLLDNLGEGAEDWGEGETPRGGIVISPNFMVMAREVKK